MKKYLDTKEQIDWEEVPQDEIVEEEWKPEAPEIQRLMWNLFEHPHTSIAARIVGIISVSCIFLSTIILTLDTMPYFEDHQDKIMDQFAPFVIIEAIYMVWFTFEFIIRFACCPSKVGFCKKTMNWIDLLGKVHAILVIISTELLQPSFPTSSRSSSTTTAWRSKLWVWSPRELRKQGPVWNFVLIILDQNCAGGRGGRGLSFSFSWPGLSPGPYMEVSISLIKMLTKNPKPFSIDNLFKCYITL